MKKRFSGGDFFDEVLYQRALTVTGLNLENTIT